MKATLSFLLLVLGFSGIAQAQSVEIDRIAIIDSGIYSVSSGSDADKSPSGSDAGIKLIKKTSTIEARIGVTFGFQYVVVGRPRSEQVQLTEITLFPPPGLKDPKVKSMMLRHEQQIDVAIGELDATLFTLEHDWELVPGKWIFELRQGDRLLASETFEVVKP